MFYRVALYIISAHIYVRWFYSLVVYPTDPVWWRWCYNHQWWSNHSEADAGSSSSGKNGMSAVGFISSSENVTC